MTFDELRTVSKLRVLAGLLALLLLGLCVPHGSAAQSWRADGTLYLRPKLGLNTYGGDWAGSTALLSGPPGPSTGLEVGYRNRLGPFSGSLGGYFLAGRYPAIARGAAAGSGALVSELEQWRHTLGVVGQIDFAPRARLNPYAQLGAGATVGNLGADFRAAFSPIGGVGLDVALTPQVGLFAEAAGILGLPDRGLDGTADADGRGADWFSFLGVGVRIDLGSGFTPVDVRGIDGPVQLRSGEAATFTARANAGEASGSVLYQWDFGDRSSLEEGSMVTHRFQEPGNYTLVLTARNEGSTDQQRLTVTVTEPSPAVADQQAGATAPADSARETTVRFPGGEDAGNGASADTAGVAAEAATEQQQERAPAVASSVSCDDIVELNATHFEEGSDALNARGQAALEENAEVLRQCPDLRVRLDAFAQAGEPGAEALAEARARTVERFYQRADIADRRIGAGDVEVAARPDGKDGATALRRVETVPALSPATASVLLGEGRLALRAVPMWQPPRPGSFVLGSSRSLSTPDEDGK